MAVPRVVFRLFAILGVAAGVLLVSDVRMSCADPITVRFTVSPDPADRINAGISTGFFTFDSALIPDRPLEVTDDEGGLASDLSFAWGSTLWTEDTAGVVVLRFDQFGRLRDFRIGGSPNGVLGMWHIPIDDFWLNSQVMNYTLLGQVGEHFFNARVTSPDLPPVPEPGTFVLIGTGAVYLIRRRLQMRGTTIRA
jgi:hypothetical protein